MELYQSHLDAGVASGIDPKLDPAGFRKAGQSKLRQIYLGPSRPVIHPGAGSGSSGSAQ
jgi:hypothetical protein